MKTFKIRLTLEGGYLATVLVNGTDEVKTNDDAVRFVADLMYAGRTTLFNQADGSGLVAINMAAVSKAFSV